MTTTASMGLAHRLDASARWLQDASNRRSAELAAGAGVTAGLTIGYVVWLVRGGILVSSMLSALPVWQMLDPVPVAAGRRSAARGDEDDQETPAERLFDRAVRRSARRGVRRGALSSVDGTKESNE